MISLTRLNGQTVAINPDLMTWIEVTPDTTVSLLGGEKLIVRESLDDVIAKVIEFRRAIAGAEVPVRYNAAMERLAARRSDYPGPARTSDRPPAGTRFESDYPGAPRR